MIAFAEGVRSRKVLLNPTPQRVRALLSGYTAPRGGYDVRIASMNRILVEVKPNRMRLRWRSVLVSSNRTWDIACTLFTRRDSCILPSRGSHS
jgi:hypothetical protein